MKNRNARETIARWLHNMNTATKWKADSPATHAAYYSEAEEYMAEPENMIMRAEAWDEALNHVETFLLPTTRRAAHADNPYRVKQAPSSYPKESA